MAKAVKQMFSGKLKVKITKVEEDREGLSHHEEGHDTATCPHCIASQNGNKTRCAACETFVLPSGKVGRPWGAGNCEDMTVFTGTVIAFTTEDGQSGQVWHEGQYDQTKVAAAITKWQTDAKVALAAKHPAEGTTITVKV